MGYISDEMIGYGFCVMVSIFFNEFGKWLFDVIECVFVYGDSDKVCVVYYCGVYWKECVEMV